MSDFRSFGSNYFPSSQSRKISIGVMAGSPAKRNPESNKGDVNALPRVEKLNSATATELEMNKKDEGNSATNRRNPTQAPGHASSPWRSPRSSSRKLGTLENVLSKQTSSLSCSKGLQKWPNEVNQAPAADSVQKLPVSSFLSNDSKLYHVKKKGKDGLPERLEEFAPVASQEKVASGRVAVDKPDNAENGSTHVLRTKLWEILGNGSSPKNQHSNSEGPEVVDNNSDLCQDKDSKGVPLVEPRHNSDPIETDSQSPEIATRRPVTKSLLLKRVPAKGAQRKTKAGANLGRKQKEQETNIFTFEEGSRAKIAPAMNFCSSPKKKKGRKRTVKQCRKPHTKDEAEGNPRETNTSETLPPSDNVQTGKTSSFSNRERSFGGFLPHDKAWLQKPQNVSREEDFDHSQAKETSTKAGVLHGTSENMDKHEGMSNPIMGKPVEPLNDFHSPTFGYKTPASSLSPCFSPAVTPLHPRDSNPALEETETPIFSFRTKKISQEACQATNAERETSDVSEKSRDYCDGRENSAELHEDLESLSESSSDETDSNKTAEDSPAMDPFNCSEEEEERVTSHHGHRKKSKFVFHAAKRNSNPKGTRLGEPSPSLSSPRGFHETDCFPGSSELGGDDGLGRAITFFALALQNFEKKLNSAASKKSLEIISSVSDEINLQMGNVQSHILTDVGKLSNLTKTKRKHAETRVQEQKEKLRMIHERFKDEISHHLEDLKSTIKGLEENQTELRGTIKRQKVSHQKLITKLEGEVEAQLVNATRRINAVNESARGKMVQLKKIVAEMTYDILE